MLKIEAELSASSAIPWLQKALESLQKAEAFVMEMRRFRARKAYTPLRPDGTIDEKSPVYRILSEGTQEEADAGMFVTAPVVGSRFSSITPWSLMPCSTVPIVAGGYTYMNGVCVPDPAQYALAYICECLYIEPAKYIFASRDCHGDCADFFFPVDNSVYLRVTVNARYSDVRVYGFDGDPTAFAATTVRAMRVSEWDLRADGADMPVQPCPTALAMEFSDGKWRDQRVVTLADVMAATQCLKRMPNERGEPYLVG